MSQRIDYEGRTIGSLAQGPGLLFQDNIEAVQKRFNIKTGITRGPDEILIKPLQDFEQFIGWLKQQTGPSINSSILGVQLQPVLAICLALSFRIHGHWPNVEPQYQVHLSHAQSIEKKLAQG